MGSVPDVGAAPITGASRPWSRFIFEVPRHPQNQAFVIGVLPGEGIGPEVVEAALQVLRAVESTSSCRFEVVRGGDIGLAAVREHGQALSRGVIEFCSDVFAERGAILAGPGGGRFVYEMRRQFDLFCKLNPLAPRPELSGAGRMRAEHGLGVDILIVRESSGGIYQGQWSEVKHGQNGQWASQTFTYSETQVRRILNVAAAIAQERRGELAVVVKPNGIPSMSELWIDCARDVARGYSVRLRELEVDYAVYHLIQDPRMFDVVVTPNLFGDVMADVGGVLMASRGLCHGASFSADGAAVYQTNHGAAHDLAGTDRANPAGQMFSLAMLLRESFGLSREAALIESAVSEVWRQGFRTADVAEEGCGIIGTREAAARIAEAVERLAPAKG